MAAESGTARVPRPTVSARDALSPESMCAARVESTVTGFAPRELVAYAATPNAAAPPRTANGNTRSHGDRRAARAVERSRGGAARKGGAAVPEAADATVASALAAVGKSRGAAAAGGDCGGTSCARGGAGAAGGESVVRPSRARRDARDLPADCPVLTSSARGTVKRAVALRAGSMSASTSRPALHEHSTPTTSITMRDRGLGVSWGIDPLAISRTTRSTGGRARNRRAGNPPGVDRCRAQAMRCRSVSGRSPITMPCRWRDARNPSGENLASMAGSLAPGQSPTNVMSTLLPCSARRYRAAATGGLTTDTQV
jgi:hypothetical protein